MATRTRRATVARTTGRKKKGRTALWLIAGLLLGAALMYGAQRVAYRDGQPFRGLAGLVDSGAKAVDRKDQPGPGPSVERPPKPKFDFYTILPEYETVLPEPKPARKVARPEQAETGTSHVYVLQAAAYARPEDADRLKARLTLNGFDAHIEKIIIQGRGEYSGRAPRTLCERSRRSMPPATNWRNWASRRCASRWKKPPA
ncbi:MAG: SPOR domain-containing protein [Chromatiales bacterium]|nr:SPOR domain-containing protein [Chromatiales bacterium]